MEINFRAFDSKSELSAQRDLFKLSFPETVGTPLCEEEHYGWKFHSFPSERTSYEYVAEYENELVGYYAAIPYRYKIGREIVTCGMVCDVMTHPKMRGKGVFTKIGNYSTEEMREEKLAFTTGYPIRPEVIPGHLKVGWKVAFDLPMFICPIISNDILKEKKLGLLSPLVNIVLEGLHFLISVFTPTTSSDVNLVDISLNDAIQNEMFINFSKKWQEQVENVLVKDKNFYDWRFSAPGAEYRVACTKKGRSYTSVAIFRVVNLKGVESLALLDLMVDNDYFDHKNALLLYLKTLVKKYGATVIAGITSNTWYKKYELLKLGYIKSPIHFKFICKNLNLKDEKDLLDESKWHLMWIDSDDL